MHRVAVVVLALAPAVVTSGCSPDDDDAGPTTRDRPASSTTTSSTTGTTAEPAAFPTVAAESPAELVRALFGFADPAGSRGDLRGIPAANGSTIDGPHEVGTAIVQPG